GCAMTSRNLRSPSASGTRPTATSKTRTRTPALTIGRPAHTLAADFDAGDAGAAAWRTLARPIKGDRVMAQRDSGVSVDRRRFLKRAAGRPGGAARATWSLGRPARARAAAPSNLARAAEPNPKRGGVLKWAGPAEVPHFDVHQGAGRATMCHLYNNLARFNPADGLKTILPDLAESWKISPDAKVYTFKLRDRLN